MKNNINKHSSPQREIVQTLRTVILKAVLGVTEEFKMGVPWYSRKFYLVAHRDHVNLGFSVQGLSEVEKNLFRGKGSLMRHLKFYSLKDVYEAEIAKLVGLVAEKSTCCYQRPPFFGFAGSNSYLLFCISVQQITFLQSQY